MSRNVGDSQQYNLTSAQPSGAAIVAVGTYVIDGDITIGVVTAIDATADPKTITVQTVSVRAQYGVIIYDGNLPVKIGEVQDNTDPAATARAAKYSVVMSAIAFDQTPTINTNFRIQFGEDEAASVNCSTGATVPSTSEDFINLLAGTSFTYGGKTWNAAIVGSRVTRLLRLWRVQPCSISSLRRRRPRRSLSSCLNTTWAILKRCSAKRGGINYAI